MATKSELRNRWKREPGLSILKAINEFCNRLEHGHGRSSEKLFRMLDGVPYRSEIATGRDLRGAEFAGTVDMELRACDFSYGCFGHFINCDLTGSRFDGAATQSMSVGKLLD